MSRKQHHPGIPFAKGRPKTGGRAPGARNRLSTAFILAIAEAFEERGEECIRIMIAEEPADFLRLCAGLLPKEFEITDNRLKDLPDEQLDQFIEFARRHLASGLGDAAAGEGETVN
jgi:hypothetical protein